MMASGDPGVARLRRAAGGGLPQGERLVRADRVDALGRDEARVARHRDRVAQRSVGARGHDAQRLALELVQRLALRELDGRRVQALRREAEERAAPERADAGLGGREGEHVIGLDLGVGVERLAPALDAGQLVLLRSRHALGRCPPPVDERMRGHRDLHAPLPCGLLGRNLPAQQQRRHEVDDQRSDQRGGKRHGGVREHPHLDPPAGGDAGDEEVRARADQRDRARQGGDVRDRQQHLARRDASRLLELARGGDQHRDERRRVHQRRCHPDRHHQPPQRLAALLVVDSSSQLRRVTTPVWTIPLASTSIAPMVMTPGFARPDAQLLDGRQPQDPGQRQACRRGPAPGAPAVDAMAARVPMTTAAATTIVSFGAHLSTASSRAAVNRPASRDVLDPEPGALTSGSCQGPMARSGSTARPTARRQMHHARGEDRCGAASKGARRCFCPG